MVSLLQNPVIRFVFLKVVTFLSHLSIVIPTVFVSSFCIRDLNYFMYDGLYVTFYESTHHILFTFESFAILPFSLLIFFYLNTEIEKSRSLFNVPCSNIN